MKWLTMFWTRSQGRSRISDELIHSRNDSVMQFWKISEVGQGERVDNGKYQE